MTDSPRGSAAASGQPGTADRTRIPARLEYAVRALLALAAVEPGTLSAHHLAEQQHIPLGYLYDVLAELRRADLVYARRGAEGGYALAQSAARLTLGDVVRVLDATGPFGAAVPGAVERDELGRRLGAIWLAAERATRQVFDEVRLLDLGRPGGQAADRLSGTGATTSPGCDDSPGSTGRGAR